MLGRIADPRLSELSGIAAGRLNPDVLWVHNDNAVTLFAVERSTLAVRARYVLTDANGDPYGDGDVEDIAILERPSGPEIYLGDIGSGHPDLVLHVYRVREPLLPTGSVDAMLVAERMNVSPTGLPNAETLLVDPIDGNVVIVEKDNLARVCDAGPFQTSMLVRASCTAMVDGIENPSAGDVSPDGATIAIRNELTAQVWLRRPGRPLVEAFLDPPCPFATLATPQSGECNGEALAFSGSGREIFSGSERVRGCEPDVHAYSFTP